MASFVPRFLWTVALLAALAVIGTAGYVLIEQQPLGDALYMTAITLSAVGYSEVFPLSAPGRVFTMLLLLAGITWLGFWFASLTSLIVELDLKDALRRRRSMRDIAKMKDHVIICGCGRTGRQIAQELETMDSEYVILERSPELGSGLPPLPLRLTWRSTASATSRKSASNLARTWSGCPTSASWISMSIDAPKF